MLPLEDVAEGAEGADGARIGLDLGAEDAPGPRGPAPEPQPAVKDPMEALREEQEHYRKLTSENFKEKTEPLCLQLRQEEMHDLFGSIHKKGRDAESVLIIPFGSRNRRGFLSVGSRDPLRFNNNMETMFATFISNILGRVVHKLCK